VSLAHRITVSSNACCIRVNENTHTHTHTHRARALVDFVDSPDELE